MSSVSLSLQVTCIWEFMKVKEKKSAKEVLITEFLGKINPSGWRTNRKAALSDLEYTILNNGQQVLFSSSAEASIFDILQH